MFMCDSMLGKVLHSTVDLRGLCWVKKKVVFSNAKKKRGKTSEKEGKEKKKRLLQKGLGDPTDGWDNYGCNSGLRRFVGVLYQRFVACVNVQCMITCNQRCPFLLKYGCWNSKGVIGIDWCM